MISCLKYIINRFDFKHVCFIILIFFQGITVLAQDIHFSQFYNSPLLTNPANTGMSGTDFRFANNYRNQWARVGVPYETFCTSLDKKLIIYNQSFGIGGLLIHDQSSSFNFSANELLLSLSYSRIINNQQFTVGFQPGFVYKSYNSEGLTFGSQFDQLSQFFNTSLPSLEDGLDQRLSYFDLNFGVFWHTLISNIIPSAGISISHLNMPVLKFSTSSTGSRLPMKMTFNGEVIVPVTEKMYLEPRALYSYTPGATELLLGSTGNYLISNLSIPVKEVYAVSMLRINPPRNFDALIIGAGAKLLKFDLGITYDFNISSLRKVANFNGAFEISLVYTGGGNKQKNANQPCYIIN